MPRDLTALVKEDAISNMSPLDRTDNADSVQQPQQGTMFAAQAQKNAKRDDIHPYTQTLTLSDVESCVILEEAAFPPQERATREKVSQPFPLPHHDTLLLQIAATSSVLWHSRVTRCCMRCPLVPSAVLA